ncbi:MAG TPA: [LysW]-lysine hydrolase [Anaerolineae bacterium]
MIELLEECVRIRSLSGQEANVAAYLRDHMAALGMSAHIDAAGNAVGVLGDGPRQLVLLGHMDTVDGLVPVRYENGALYGRGTVDAKGPLCAFILAAGQLAITPQAFDGWQVIVVGATEEEAATSKGARFAATQYHPEMCIIGEPSGADGVTLGYKGRLLTQARFTQTSRHTAMPGPSAAEQAVHLWNWLDGYAREFNADKPKSFDQLMPSLRNIHSDDNGMSEWCDMTIGVRLPESLGPAQLQQAIEAWAMTQPASPELVFSGHEVAWRSGRDTLLARVFVDAIRAHGVRPALKLKTGTSDLNVLGPIWGCPIVAYGPGDSSLDHTPDEHIPVAEFERGVAILEQVLRALTNPAASSKNQ